MLPLAAQRQTVQFVARSMQHKPLENVHPVTVAHAESTPAPVDRGIFTGTSGQGSALPDTEARTHQVSISRVTNSKRTGQVGLP